MKESDGEGRGVYSRGGACLILWPKVWTLIRGRALTREWALIRGNTVHVEFSKYRNKALGKH